MAKKTVRKAEGRARPKRRRLALSAFLLAAALMLGFFGWMHVNARLVRLCPAEVWIRDLPEALDGTTALFISDINISSPGEARACARMLDKLADLNVDLLLLGGDYGQKAETLSPFTAALNRFCAHLGKFAVPGEADTKETLQAISNAGVGVLDGACATVEKNGAQLVIAGLGPETTGMTPYSEIGGYFQGNECVLVLAHNPSAYVGVRVAEARGGGAWADLVLSGHNLGGQIRIFNRTLKTLPEKEGRTLAGWFYGDDLPLLVSQGVNCKGVDLRLGSRSEAWLLTLRRPEEMALPDL